MEPATPAGLSKQRLEVLHARELATFIARTRRSADLLERGRGSMIKGVPMSWMWGLYRHPPIFVERGQGATFWDVDGNSYLDFNVVDLALTVGFGAAPIVAAVSEAARRGAHFLLPVEEAIDVTQRLAALTGVPFWQFTLSASGANAEVLRIARSMTGRDKVLIFEGHYHGHVDDTLVESDGERLQPAMKGLPAGIEQHTRIVPFNDLAAAEAALSQHDVALVLTEPRCRTARSFCRKRATCRHCMSCVGSTGACCVSMRRIRSSSLTVASSEPGNCRATRWCSAKVWAPVFPSGSMA